MRDNMTLQNCISGVTSPTKNHRSMILLLLSINYMSCQILRREKMNRDASSECCFVGSAGGCRIHSVDFDLELHAFRAVPVRKKMEFLIKGGIHCISRSSLGTFILCVGTHWSN